MLVGHAQAGSLQMGATFDCFQLQEPLTSDPERKLFGALPVPIPPPEAGTTEPLVSVDGYLQSTSLGLDNLFCFPVACAPPGVSGLSGGTVPDLSQVVQFGPKVLINLTYFTTIPQCFYGMSVVNGKSLQIEQRQHPG
ncbi:hypothetical protein SRHO_G00120190 [Serrasalmus rhombeus]